MFSVKSCVYWLIVVLASCSPVNTYTPALLLAKAVNLPVRGVSTDDEIFASNCRGACERLFGVVLPNFFAVVDVDRVDIFVSRAEVDSVSDKDRRRINTAAGLEGPFEFTRFTVDAVQVFVAAADDDEIIGHDR